MTREPQSLKTIAEAAAEDRPRYFDDTATDELLAIILELAEDNCVLRDRLATAEALSPGISNRIDHHELTADETRARLEAHSEKMNALFRRVADIKETPRR